MALRIVERSRDLRSVSRDAVSIAKRRNNGKQIVRMCCMNVKSAHNAYDTLTKIGEERAPWFCEAHNIYIGFEFSTQSSHKHPEAHDSDVLTVIQIYPWSTGCL